MPANSPLFNLRCAPIITFSRALMFMHTCRFWNVRLMPRRASLSGLSLTMFSPSSRISPSLGVQIPLIRLNSVVLPAPLGPITE